MTKLMLMAGAAALLAGAPAIAKPGQGKAGHRPNAPHVVHVKPNGAAPARVHDRNRNGILDLHEGQGRKYGGDVCPPGLANRTPACVPPGQVQRMFREGQRLPLSYRYFTPYGDIPVALRDRYDLTDQYRYIYRDNVIYVVDPTTRLVTSIIDAVL